MKVAFVVWMRMGVSAWGMGGREMDGKEKQRENDKGTERQRDRERDIENERVG